MKNKTKAKGTKKDCLGKPKAHKQDNFGADFKKLKAKKEEKVMAGLGSLIKLSKAWAHCLTLMRLKIWPNVF